MTRSPSERPSRPRVRARPSRAGAVAAAALVLAAAGCAREREAPIESFHMEDLDAPTMLAHLARGLDKAYLVELPPRSVDARFDLALDGTTEGEALERLCALDPGFQCRRDADVLLMWPTGQDEAASPFSAPLPDLRESGTAGDMVLTLLERAGVHQATRVQVADDATRRRAVTIELQGGRLRDGLARVAAEAHLQVVIEPGEVRMSRLLAARPE